MVSPHWPLFGLRLRTPRLELRVPTLDQLGALGDLAADGIHDPAFQPFAVAWTDAPPADRARGTMQYHWGCWGSLRPEAWILNLVALAGGKVVGTQGMSATNFGVLREVATGSWLGKRYQGEGLGTEMRAALLHLAFAGLGAEHATSGATEDNAASLGVSRKLGYADDGVEIHLIRDQPVRILRRRLDRATWEAHRTVPVEIDGLGPCLPLLGAAGDGDQEGTG